MVTLKAKIERTQNNYSAFIENIDGIVATGSTIDEIKTNLISALDEYIQTCEEMGLELPGELKGDYSIEFAMDVRNLLTIYEGVFTKSGLERITGINQKQLWHYANGTSTPRRAQVLKLEKALHRLGQELLSLHL
ncbi:MAG: type II toxin-antitoxin system HicB family antitoxin [Bacteroidales bacterium]|nr:type II toxin-antitoxin system HicB family antitoxin [Bacteroidales bacterium]